MVRDLSEFEEQFKAEARERILKLNRGLLKLEKNPKEGELLDALMKEAHSLKGMAKMMQHESIAEIGHKMEDGLTKALNENMKMEKKHFDALFRCLDTIEQLLENKLAGEEGGVEELCEEVGELFRIGRERPQSKIRKSTSSSLATVTEESIRVDIDKLDKLMNLSGELLISKIRLNELTKHLIGEVESEGETHPELSGLMEELKTVNDSINFLTSDIQTEVMKARMVPISYLFDMFPRAMRDLAAEKKKDIELEIKGEDTQLDKSIIDEMKAPIMHILRNAVDHGIEEPAERLKKGKPKTGKILLNAFQKGSQVVIVVSDDGKGIDVDKVKAKAVKQGLVSKEKIAEMVDEEIFQLLFTPRFTTRESVTDLSGRGVGLDVVRDMVAKFKGMLEVVSDTGVGTRITMKLPLTLAITEVLLVAACNEMFAIPIDTIVETARIAPKQIKTVETKEVIAIRDHIVPLVRLNEIFGLPVKGIFEKRFFSVVIVQSAGKRIGLLVEQLLGRQEVVRKSIGDPLKKVRDIAGATILGSGRVILILDIPSIVESAEGPVIKRGAAKPRRVRKKRKAILLAEDVLTTAMMEKSILESVGYSVVIARDGKEALEKASQEKFDLVITDILMPRMDGFELTERMKKDEVYKDVPVVIVTTRESDEDKRRGLDAGAEAYILKSEFTTEELLDTIERLMG